MRSGSGNKTCISNISYCQTINYLEEHPDKIKIKIKLYLSLILSVVFYSCESWTLYFTITKKIQAFENKFHQKSLKKTYTIGKKNIYIKSEINSLL